MQSVTATVITAIVFLAFLLGACSQVEISAPNPRGEAVALSATATPQGALPATVRWSGGGLNLLGCVWREHGRSYPNVQYNYLERSRSSTHLVLHDRNRDRYLSLPRAGGQARWRKGATGTWYDLTP
jgi:hypothetical protein